MIQKALDLWMELYYNKNVSMIQKRGGFNGNSLKQQVKIIYVDKVIKAIKNNGFIIEDRPKNKIFIRRFRLNPSSIKKILLKLNASSLYKIDDDRNKDYYGDEPVVFFILDEKLVNFHGEDEKVKIYIKIKLYEDDIVPVISFHEAEH